MTAQELKKLHDDYGITRDDLYEMQRGHKKFWIVTRQGIEKIHGKTGMEITFEVVSSVHDFAAVKAMGVYKSRKMETYGSAKKGTGRDGNTTTWYVLEVAEKRAYARLVLKLLGLYEKGVKGEAETWDDEDNPGNVPAAN